MARSRLGRSWEKLYPEIRNDIFAYSHYLNWKPTSQQCDVLELIMEEKHLPIGERKQRVAVKSGQGPGKTTLSGVAMSWVVLQYLDTLGVVTAPTMRQCKEVWLAEFRRTLSNAHPILRRVIKVTKSKVIFAGRPGWQIILVSSSKPENAQGFHQERLIFLVEEAAGVPREIQEQIKGTLSNEDSMLICIGNPNLRDCAFFDCFNKDRVLWNTFTMNAEESEIVSKANIAKLEAEFGRNSDVFRVRVLGEFPLQDPNTVMSSDDLEACTKNNMLKFSQMGPVRQFGLDFARFGSDESVVVQRKGMATLSYKTFAKREPIDVCNYSFHLQLSCGWGGDTIFVPDAGGMGQGVMHAFKGKKYLEFHSEGVPTKPEYANRITEAYFGFAEKAKARSIHIPNDPHLIHQLSSRQYYINAKGQLILEKKEDFVKRVGVSPDRGDAMVLAFYDRPMAGGTVITRN